MALFQQLRHHDLFFRLQVFPIRIPPLRDRREDIPPLVWAFIKDFGRHLGKVIEHVPRQSMEALRHYAWPGNVIWPFRRSRFSCCSRSDWT